LCGGEHLSYLFASAGTPIVRCDRCGLVMRNPPPSSAEILDAPPNKPGRERVIGDLEAIESYDRLDHKEAPRLLAVGPHLDLLVSEARKRGYAVSTLDCAKHGEGSFATPFDVAIFCNALERAPDPLGELLRIRHALRPGAAVLVSVPAFATGSAWMTPRQWADRRQDQQFYFDSGTLQFLLFKAGFAEVAFEGGRALARRTEAPPPVERAHRLTVVMPVFNERATFPVVMERLLAKSIPGVDIDVVVVESNSTDGTREAVRAMEGRDRVTVVYEESPRGKGHAVRAGLPRATGDYILIQDADLEYDIDDYDSLIEPLMSGRAAFVLGSRHGKDGATWKVRHFADEVHISWFMNLGHVVFTALFNVTYGTRLRDPFTMYKVFRRDCLHGLTFDANRFDFDWELVGKLVRAGYMPLEIPVNYESRSFAEGKKVLLLRDPLTWIRACFKYRFVPLGKSPR
jgi:SAM-dependent methyltransferase